MSAEMTEVYTCTSCGSVLNSDWQDLLRAGDDLGIDICAGAHLCAGCDVPAFDEVQSQPENDR